MHSSGSLAALHSRAAVDAVTEEVQKLVAIDSQAAAEKGDGELASSSSSSSSALDLVRNFPAGYLSTETLKAFSLPQDDEKKKKVIGLLMDRLRLLLRAEKTVAELREALAQAESKAAAFESQARETGYLLILKESESKEAIEEAKAMKEKAEEAEKEQVRLQTELDVALSRYAESKERLHEAHAALHDLQKRSSRLEDEQRRTLDLLAASKNETEAALLESAKAKEREREAALKIDALAQEMKTMTKMKKITRADVETGAAKLPTLAQALECLANKKDFQAGAAGKVASQLARAQIDISTGRRRARAVSASAAVERLAYSRPAAPKQLRVPAAKPPALPAVAGSPAVIDVAIESRLSLLEGAALSALQALATRTNTGESEAERELLKTKHALSFALTTHKEALAQSSAPLHDKIKLLGAQLKAATMEKTKLAQEVMELQQTSRKAREDYEGLASLDKKGRTALLSSLQAEKDELLKQLRQGQEERAALQAQLDGARSDAVHAGEQLEVERARLALANGQLQEMMMKFGDESKLTGTWVKVPPPLHADGLMTGLASWCSFYLSFTTAFADAIRAVRPLGLAPSLALTTRRKMRSAGSRGRKPSRLSTLLAASSSAEEDQPSSPIRLNQEESGVIEVRGSSAVLSPKPGTSAPSGFFFAASDARSSNSDVGGGGGTGTASAAGRRRASSLSPSSPSRHGLVSASTSDQLRPATSPAGFPALRDDSNESGQLLPAGLSSLSSLSSSSAVAAGGLEANKQDEELFLEAAKARVAPLQEPMRELSLLLFGDRALGFGNVEELMAELKQKIAEQEEATENIERERSASRVLSSSSSNRGTSTSNPLDVLPSALGALFSQGGLPLPASGGSALATKVKTVAHALAVASPATNAPPRASSALFSASSNVGARRLSSASSTSMLNTEESHPSFPSTVHRARSQAQTAEAVAAAVAAVSAAAEEAQIGALPAFGPVASLPSAGGGGGGGGGNQLFSRVAGLMDRKQKPSANLILNLGASGCATSSPGSSLPRQQQQRRGSLLNAVLAGAPQPRSAGTPSGGLNVGSTRELQGWEEAAEGEQRNGTTLLRPPTTAPGHLVPRSRGASFEGAALPSQNDEEPHEHGHEGDEAYRSPTVEETNNVTTADLIQALSLLLQGQVGSQPQAQQLKPSTQQFPPQIEIAAGAGPGALTAQTRRRRRVSAPPSTSAPALSSAAPSPRSGAADQLPPSLQSALDNAAATLQGALVALLKNQATSSASSPPSDVLPKKKAQRGREGKRPKSGSSLRPQSRQSKQGEGNPAKRKGSRSPTAAPAPVVPAGLSSEASSVRTETRSTARRLRLKPLVPASASTVSPVRTPGTKGKRAKLEAQRELMMQAQEKAMSSEFASDLVEPLPLVQSQSSQRMASVSAGSTEGPSEEHDDFNDSGGLISVGHRAKLSSRLSQDSGRGGGGAASLQPNHHQHRPLLLPLALSMPLSSSSSAQPSPSLGALPILTPSPKSGVGRKRAVSRDKSGEVRGGRIVLTSLSASASGTSQPPEGGPLHPIFVSSAAFSSLVVEGSKAGGESGAPSQPPSPQERGRLHRRSTRSGSPSPRSQSPSHSHCRSRSPNRSTPVLLPAVAADSVADNRTLATSPAPWPLGYVPAGVKMREDADSYNTALKARVPSRLVRPASAGYALPEARPRTAEERARSRSGSAVAREDEGGR